MADSKLSKIKKTLGKEGEKLFAELERERQEFAQQLKLLGSDAKEEWDEIETKVKGFGRHFGRFSESAGQATKGGAKAVRTFNQALKQAFSKKSDKTSER